MFGFLKKKAQKNSGGDLKTATFQIDGMHCTSCSLNIDGALEDSKGVKSASTSYAKSQAKIEYNPKEISEDALKKVIENEGYGAHLLS